MEVEITSEHRDVASGVLRDLPPLHTLFKAGEVPAVPSKHKNDFSMMLSARSKASLYGSA